MRTRVEHVVEGHEDVLAWGLPSEVQRWLARANATGRLAAVTTPRPHQDGVAVRARFRRAHELPAPRPGAVRPAPVRRLPVVQRQTLARAGAVLGALAVVAGLGWLALRGLAAGAAWAADRAGLLVAVGMLAVAVVGLWLTRSRPASGECPGMTHHCAACPDHGRVR